MKNGKVVIIGSGFVGAAIGYALTYIKSVSEIVFIDKRIEAVQGETMDISHGISSISTAVVREGNYADCTDSDVIIITAGMNRKVGQTRMDLLEHNKKIMDDIMDELKNVYKDSFVIIVSNPVDALTEEVIRKRIIPEEKICGTGCMLDTSRWISEIAKYLKVNTSRITAYSIGKHGTEPRMLWEMAKVDEEPIEEYCKKNEIFWNEDVKVRLQKKVTEMGAEIIRRKGKTQYGIATVVGYLVDCLLKDNKTLVSVGTILGTNDKSVSSRLVYMGNRRITNNEEK